MRKTMGAVEPSASAGKQPTMWGEVSPWQYKRRGSNRCSNCNRKRDRKKQRYCRSCRAAYMRLYRQRAA